MALPSLLPLRLQRSRRCQRCGLRYPRKAAQCPHCADLEEQGLAALRERVAEEHAGAAELGRFLGIAAAVIAAALLALALL